MRKAAWALGLVTLLASGAYVFIYLYRWEWHRAMFVALVFVAAEVALAAGVVLRRLPAARAAEVEPARQAAPDPQVLARVRAAEHGRDHFAWLRRELGRTNVFLTTMLGGGAILSVGAWALDRIAHRTAGPTLARSLATRLGALAFPDDGLVPDDAALVVPDAPDGDDADLRLLLGPHPGSR